MSPLILNGKQLVSVAGRSLFDYADDLSVRVPTSCGRSGECHECIVEVKQGSNVLTPSSPAEFFLAKSYRLACQARIADTASTVEFNVLRRQPKILTKGVRRPVDLAPSVFRREDAVYLTRVTEHGSASASGDGDKYEKIEAYSGAVLGLAIDMGTTTVVMNLVDLESGVVLQTSSFENPQRFGGSDIMNRISYDGGRFHGEMQAVMLSAVNFEIGEMCRALKRRRRQIYETVVVGNATMRDLFFGLDVQPIGQKPYKSVTETDFKEGKRHTTAINVSAESLGLRIHPRANVYGGPLIASHVGADTAADIAALGLEDATAPFILVDVGTNTEVVVGTKDRMLAASCPAGPAFEGGEVKFGMPGYDGAIERIRARIPPENTKEQNELAFDYETIGGAEPQGICGSGLVDLLAELRRTGFMNQLGAFAPGTAELTVVPGRGITISRKDISALAQAKAANYCGQSILTRAYGLAQSEFSALYLAGGFANYIDSANAVAIGFIANVPPEKIIKVGNASLEGATVLLLSLPVRRKIEQFVPTIQHIELETTPDFFDFFVEGCQFKPMQLPS